MEDTSPRWRRLLRRARIDVAPLRTSRDYRYLFTSGLVTYLGSMVTFVTMPFQVATLTDSYLAVGLLGVAELVPLVVFGLWGGALADAVDRRRMAVVTEVVAGVLAVVLMCNALLPSPQLWLIYVVAAIFAAVDALQRPSIEAMVPRVVAHDQLAAAAALNSLRFQVGSILGPAIGGFVAATAGPSVAYGIDATTFVVSVLVLRRIRRLPPTRTREGSMLRGIGEGLRYAVTRRDLLGTYLVDVIAMVFAFPYALFPFLAQEFGTPWALGLLYAAVSVGSLLATVTSGWTAHVHHHGRAVVVAAFLWGIAIALVGVSPGIWWVLLFLVLAGAADMVSGLFRMLIWNQTIPDELRGRLAGIELLSYAIGPQLGQLRASGVAAVTSLRTSLVSGGVLCAAACVGLPFVLPSLWRYDARTDPNAVRERERRARLSADPDTGGPTASA